MGHEPSRLVLAAQLTGQLKGADPFLARAHGSERIHPVAQGHLATLEDAAHRYGELLAALFAAIDARTDLVRCRRFDLHNAGLVNVAAMRAGLAIGPNETFQHGPCFFFREAL